MPTSPSSGPSESARPFSPNALGHIACRRGAHVLAVRTDQMLKTLKHARLDNSYDAELRIFIAVDLLILEDFAIDVLDPVESRNLHDLALGALSQRLGPKFCGSGTFDVC